MALCFTSLENESSWGLRHYYHFCLLLMNSVTVQRYKSAGQDTIILAGAEYGTGSSRDWAAKGPMLLVTIYRALYNRVISLSVNFLVEIECILQFCHFVL